jgi:hypothetical protein
MNVVELEAKLTDWCREATDIAVPSDKMPAFLARRIVDSGLTSVQEDHNVTTAIIDGRVRKVRVVGRQGGHIQYEIVDGYGFGILPVAGFTDNSKLAEIVDRLEAVR